MPDALINRTPAGWPYLDEDNYLDVIDNYTVELAAKLQNSDADVAAAVNAASKIALGDWTTLASGLDPAVTSGTVRLRSWGYLVELDISVAGSFAPGNTNVAPPGFVPGHLRPSSGGAGRLPGYGGGGYLATFWIAGDGSVGVTHRAPSDLPNVQGRGLGYLRNA